MRSREHLLTLAAEIRDELAKLSELARSIESTWKRRSTAPREEQDVFLESVALKLHNFYTGCERIFGQVGTEINGALPQTHDWHVRLLRTMCVEVPEVRPAVLSAALARDLEDYLRFRHLVRNIYALELDAAKIEPLVGKVADVAGRFEDEIERFVRYLETLAHGLPEDEPAG